MLGYEGSVRLRFPKSLGQQGSGEKDLFLKASVALIELKLVWISLKSLPILCLLLQMSGPCLLQENKEGF